MDSVRTRPGRRAGLLLLGALMATLIALAGRLVQINVAQRPRLMARAQQQQQSVVPLPARRGLVIDAMGRILAGSALQQSVFADPQLVPDKHEAARVLSRVLGLPAVELGQDLIAAGQRRFFVIQRGIEPSQADQLNRAAVPGLGTFEEPYRHYPLGSLAAAMLGFVSVDGVGLAGLEHQCDDWLRGEAGMKTIVRDAGRRAFWLAEEGYVPPRDGYHVVLTLDAVIQSAAERELSAAIERFQAESGIAIVMEPATGAVLALAHVPGFDPNHFRDYAAGSGWRFRPRAITDPFEPGSTFKPFIAAPALAEGLVRPGEMIDCEGGLWRDGKRLLHDHHPYSGLTFEEVLTKSSNIGMAKIGKRLGPQRMQAWLKKWGFGEKSGIDLVGEDAGIVPPRHRWTSFTTTSVPMGQELAVTPMQLCRAFCAFANGGKLVRPYFVRAVLASDGSVVQEFGPQPGREVLKPGTADWMKRHVLAAAVNSGTGTRAALARYQVFGKTGTAQVPRIGGAGYVPDGYVGSFVGAAPLEEPRMVVLVSVRMPKRSIGYYGGTVAAPAAREILAAGLAYLGVPPERDAPPRVAQSAAVD